MAIPTDIAGLWGWWKADALTLNDGDPIASWTDSSGNGRHMVQALTAGERPTYQTNEFYGQPVVNFNANQWFDLPDMSALTAGTVFLLVKLEADPPAAAGQAGLWDMGSSTEPFFGSFPYPDGVIYDEWGTTGGKSSVDPGWSLEAWSIYVVKSAPGNWTNYLMGNELYTTPTNTVGFTTTPRFGSTAPSPTLQFLWGDVAELFIFDTALSDVNREAMEDYLSAKWFLITDYSTEVLADDPVAYFRLNEPTGTNANDLGSANHAGTYNNTPTLGVAGPIQSEVNTAVTFTAASSESVTTTDVADYNVGDTFTLEAWVKCSGTGTHRAVVSMNDGAPYMRVNPTGQIELLKSQVALLGASATLVNDDAWHHVVWTKAGATSVLYIDAVVRTPAITNATMANTALGLFIGADKSIPDAPGEFMNGSIDEVALYSYALPPARVNVHFHAARAAAARLPVGMFDSEMRSEQWF